MADREYEGMTFMQVFMNMLAENLQEQITRATCGATKAQRADEKYWERVRILQDIERVLRGEELPGAMPLRKNTPRDVLNRAYNDL